MAFFLIVFVMIFGFCMLSVTLFRWIDIVYNKKNLPPGTMGWPIFGETREFLNQGPNFMKNQRVRYGNFFKSHILGCPTIVSMDAELNGYILNNEANGLVPGYPQSMLDILGKCNIAAVHGAAHKHIRGTLLSLISPTMIKDHVFPKIDEFMRSHLSNWDNCNVIDIQQKTKEMAFFSSLDQIGGFASSSSISQKFRAGFLKLVLGTISLPINFPTTNYHRGFQGRKNIVKLLRKIIEDRRGSKEIQQDMLGFMMNEEAKARYKLSDEEIIDQIITILYSGFETVSTTSMMAVKYLHDHPKALEQLRKEHLAIREKKLSLEDPIDYNDYKAMRFTRAVIYETSRLATIVNGVLRKTTQDMELNGYMIPKGWRIYVYTRELNYDPQIYPDPYTFNPWRWLENNLEYQSSFLMFGGGTRLCPGKELGVAEISTFLHYFVTRYRWEEVGGNKLMKFPRVEAPNGLWIKVSTY
ncbi:cytochrome P450 85A3 [Solanum stenotomum]|uniref:cytochrome P450 85A3 n=1 Tax=Solanum stenotomum TaxID=172797 RepID=UPI0020D048F0|nr:cytochrome P450 85A3 [Solanum stenotomum]